MRATYVSHFSSSSMNGSKASRFFFMYSTTSRRNAAWCESSPQRWSDSARKKQFPSAAMGSTRKPMSRSCARNVASSSPDDARW